MSCNKAQTFFRVAGTREIIVLKSYPLYFSKIMADMSMDSSSNDFDIASFNIHLNPAIARKELHRDLHE